jgi:exosortase A
MEAVKLQPTSSNQPLWLKDSWLKAGLILAATWVGLVFLLPQTFMNMVQIWEGSQDTYSYGYVILPITLWLLWRNREALARTPASPDWKAFLVLMPLAGIWLAARVSGVQVVEQYAFVSIAIVSVWACFGWGWFKSTLFPFMYLLLMVPNGDFLMPSLINYTADFTTLFIQFVGIPIYREGPYLTLPTGNWVVVEACGGLRYLTTSITLGFLFAYLTYYTWWKRLAFSVAAVLIALWANGMRAVMVVLTGHYSDMTLMVGEDHIWFGWGWFGLVMLVTFWIGGFWREDTDPAASSPDKPAEASTVTPRSPLLIAIIICFSMALFPQWEDAIAARTGTQLKLTAPTAQSEWVSPDSAKHDPASITWTPSWQNPDATLAAYYAKSTTPVMLYVAHYARQRQGAELISHANLLHRALRGDWEFVSEQRVTAQLHTGMVSVVEAHLRDPESGQRLMVLHWNHVGGKELTNPYLTKLQLVINLLLGKGDAAAAVMVATPYTTEARLAEARTVLKDYVAAHAAGIHNMLNAE